MEKYTKKNNLKTNILATALFLLLVLPFFAFGQTLHNKDFSFTKSFPSDLLPITCSGTYQYYYDEDGRRVIHGKMVCNGNESWHKGFTEKSSYNATANYSDGLLNGNINIKFSDQVSGKGRSYNQNFLMTGNYKNGTPDGEWKIANTVIADGKKRDTLVNAKFKNGKMIYFLHKINNQIITNITIDTNGTAKGIAYDYVVDKGIITNFISRTGIYEYSKPEENEQKIIKNIVQNNGQFDTSELIEQGYIVRNQGINLDNKFVKYVTEYEYAYIYNYNQESEADFRKSYKGGTVTVNILEKVKVISYNEAINLIKKSTYSNKYVLKEINEQYCIDSYYYLKKEDRDKLALYLKEKIAESERVAEANRRENARIAEEKLIEETRQKQVVENQKTIQNKIDKINKTCLTIVKYTNEYTVFKDKKYKHPYNSFAKVTKNYLDWLKDKEKNSNSRYDSDIKYTDKEALYFKRIDSFLNYFIQNILEGTEVKQIQDNYERIKELAGKTNSDVADDYKNLYKQYDLTPTFSTLDEFDAYVEVLSNIKKEQEACIRFINCRKQITQGSNKIAEFSDKDCFDVLKAYKKFEKNYNLSFVKDTISDFQRIDNFLSVQDNCLQFITLRKEIARMNEKIDSHKKECKNIIKAYASYFNSVDLSWTSEPKSMENVEKVISIQKQILRAVTSNNASELESVVKNMKDRNIDSVLKAINQ